MSQMHNLHISKTISPFSSYFYSFLHF